MKKGVGTTGATSRMERMNPENVLNTGIHFIQDLNLPLIPTTAIVLGPERAFSWSWLFVVIETYIGKLSSINFTKHNLFYHLEEVSLSSDLLLFVAP